MRKRYLFLVIAVTFGLALHMVERYTTGITSPLPETDAKEADYYGEKLIHRQYSNNGKLQQTLMATESHYYPDSGLTHFSSPALVSQNDTGGWQINAAKGRLSDNSTQLYLEDDVRIQSVTGEPDFLLLETSRLTYHADRGQATTNDPVTIRSRRGTTHATGISLDTFSQRLTLKSDVRTRYEQH